MNKYYRSKITGNIFSTTSVVHLIYGNDGIDKLIREDVIEEIDTPSIEDLIKHSTKINVIMRYRELHPNCTLQEAKDAIDQLYLVYKSSHIDLAGAQIELMERDKAKITKMRSEVGKKLIEHFGEGGDAL